MYVIKNGTLYTMGHPGVIQADLLVENVWTTKIDVKNMVFTGKVCNNMGKGGKCRKIKGFPELIV